MRSRSENRLFLEAVRVDVGCRDPEVDIRDTTPTSLIYGGVEDCPAKAMTADLRLCVQLVENSNAPCGPYAWRQRHYAHRHRLKGWYVSETLGAVE